jgi:anthranilate synthase component 1
VRAEIPGVVDLLELHELDRAAYPFLLQSVAGHPQSGRFDILFAFPQAQLALRDGQLEGHASGADFFAALSAWFASEAAAAPVDELPFAGGWFLLLGYEAAQHIEPRLRLPRSPFALPDALAVRCPAAAIFDRQRGVTTLVCESDPRQLEQLRRDLQRAQRGRAREGSLLAAIGEDEPQRFVDGVARIHEYLRPATCSR